jgi:hypothetical protein
MHAATPDTQPRAASTRQLISKGLHIKNHIIDLDIEHRERERERERENSPSIGMGVQEEHGAEILSHIA